ncbi:NAD(P)H-hydrate dehydratase [Anaerococcus urinomassiliensis]|uniref:NAD(P)H-hydrate dehydratase n=1 Tax=Anaerococcus urinomassiliensis TaxID=1745712 RepID=UPI00093FA650|nr:NAD(P)H-hydrate dehydratase [Anaerococcus urinomassiliensis]
MIGIDLVNIEKFSKKTNILNTFTENEISHAASKVNTNESLAGIYAAKEAIIKACGLNLYYILRKKIEIKYENDKPVAYINGQESKVDISISHDGSYAISVCSTTYNGLHLVDDEVKNILPKRNSDTHKGTYGKIGFLGGSPGMAGSIYMASLAALRSGAGLTYILAPESIADILAIKSNEQIIKEISCNSFCYKENIKAQIISASKNLDVLAIGPGMGQAKDLHILIDEIIKNTKMKLVIDADGINAISNDLTILNVNREIILTPHLGEFSRLIGLSIDDIKKDKINLAKKFAKTYNVILVLKSNETIITDGDRLYINKIGNPGMATAGSGDVLTGIISSLLKRLQAYDAALLGVYIHSLAGDLAAEDLGEESIIASDVINHLADAFKLLRNSYGVIS